MFGNSIFFGWIIPVELRGRAAAVGRGIDGRGLRTAVDAERVNGLTAARASRSRADMTLLPSSEAPRAGNDGRAGSAGVGRLRGGVAGCGRVGVLMARGRSRRGGGDRARVGFGAMRAAGCRAEERRGWVGWEREGDNVERRTRETGRTGRGGVRVAGAGVRRGDEGCDDVYDPLPLRGGVAGAVRSCDDVSAICVNVVFDV